MNKSGKGGFGTRPETINRRGRPKKGETYTDLLIEMGKRPVDPSLSKDKQITIKEAIIRKTIKLALEGDVSMLKYLFDRIDGKPRETIDISDGREDKLDVIIQKINEKSQEAE